MFIWILIGLIILTIVVRFNYGKHLPFSGDEVGVGVLQSVGKFSTYSNSLPVNQITDISDIRKFIQYSDKTSAADVISTMRSDRLHPPLYFVILHFVIKYFGTGVAELRTLSLLFSIFSLITIYFIGKVLFNESVGVISAVFMAVSAYCLEYSVMVRLYPLAMWLSLLSTLLVIMLVKSGKFNFRSGLLYLYIIVSVAGLYTYYSFGVLLASHFFFVVLSDRLDLKALASVILTYIIMVVLLVPWILPMMDGVNSVQTKDYYFKGTYSLPLLFQYFFELIFVPFKNHTGSINTTILSAFALFLGVVISYLYITGVYKASRSRITFSFVVSVVLYFSIFIISDKILLTKTMGFDRQHYFAVPVLLLLLASSVVYFSKVMYLRRTAIVILTLLFIAGLIYRYQNKSMFDGPYYFIQLSLQIERQSLNTGDKENLIIYNAMDKRYLLPFIHMTERNYDLMIIPFGMNDTVMRKLHRDAEYRNIFLVNIDAPATARKRLRMQSINAEQLYSYLKKDGYLRNSEPYIYQNIEKLTITRFSR